MRAVDGHVDHLDLPVGGEDLMDVLLQETRRASGLSRFTHRTGPERTGAPGSIRQETGDGWMEEVTGCDLLHPSMDDCAPELLWYLDDIPGEPAQVHLGGFGGGASPPAFPLVFLGGFGSGETFRR